MGPDSRIYSLLNRGLADILFVKKEQSNKEHSAVVFYSNTSLFLH